MFDMIKIPWWLWMGINCILAAVLVIVLGLRLQPAPFPPIAGEAKPLKLSPLPEGLPTPVERFYKTIGAEHIPQVESAVISARGTTRFAGVVLPARLRFTHEAGVGYRHYIETTFFGRPVLKVNEWYLDGSAKLALPFGTVENDPKVDMAANLGLWGESLWLPSIYLTDSRVRWEAIDASTARLIVPFESAEDQFIVYFDAESGLITHMDAMRFKDPASDEKVGWYLEVLEWGSFNGLLLPSYATATWADEGTPWLVMQVEEVIYNIDVETYIRATGY